MSEPDLDFSDLRALFVNTTLTRSPGVSHTQRLIDISGGITTILHPDFFYLTVEYANLPGAGHSYEFDCQGG